ncbi:MAG: hypothetical protein G01um101472_18 [Parcubacteria group bacterium Gr01-1014_72]|nr:MAG: hypothetical protein G01um101472_18 [Parcubacteria group bacterium Gr01-1014_72]
MNVHFDRNSGRLMLTALNEDEREMIRAISETPTASGLPERTGSGVPYQVILDLTGVTATRKISREEVPAGF